MTVTPEMARAIVDEFLTTVGAATLAGDFDTFLSRMHLPQEFETYRGRQQIPDRDAALAVFNLFSKQLEKLGVTDFVRTCVTAQYQDTSLISATYETRLMRGTYLLRDPYPSYAMFRRIDGVWKLVNSMYALDNIENLQVGSPQPVLNGSRNT